MPDIIHDESCLIVPKGTPTIYRAGRRAFMPDTIHDESCLKALLPALLPVILTSGICLLYHISYFLSNCSNILPNFLISSLIACFRLALLWWRSAAG